jgi:hypothetical protein
MCGVQTPAVSLYVGAIEIPEDVEKMDTLQWGVLLKNESFDKEDLAMLRIDDIA